MILARNILETAGESLTTIPSLLSSFLISPPTPGLMQRRDASINDVRINASDRRYIRNPKTGLVEFPLGHPADK